MLDVHFTQTEFVKNPSSWKVHLLPTQLADERVVKNSLTAESATSPLTFISSEFRLYFEETLMFIICSCNET